MAGTGAGAVVPPGDDAIWVAIRDLERKLQELYAIASGGKAIATAVQTGLGTLASSGTTWAGPVASPSTISAAGNASIGGDINLTGDLYTPHGRATPVVVSYVAGYLDSVGRLGATPSSVAYKRDFAAADTAPLVDALLGVALVRFRYIQAVEELGDEAELELGAIAEYFDAVGLGEYVFRHEDGSPMGIKYERLSIPLIAVVQRLDADRRYLGAQVDALTARLDAAGL